jgi:hypothetical protein
MTRVRPAVSLHMSTHEHHVRSFQQASNCYMSPNCCPLAACLLLYLVQIANNRYNFFGKTNTCRLSADGFQDRFLGA